jgi:TRAP-type C4-dicarboxylate transport system permease small subunit
LRAARRLDQAIVLVGIVVVAATIGSLFLAIFTNVVLRYLFDQGIVWAYEIPAILFPWMVAGGAVLASQAGRHIAVEILIAALPPRPRRALAIAVNLAVVGVAVAVVDAAQPILQASQYSRLAETGIPQSWGYMSLVVGFALIGLSAVTTLVRLLAGQAPTGAQTTGPS